MRKFGLIRLVGLVGLIWLVGLTTPAAQQNAPLRVTSAAPSGELQQLEDANEIRIVFSEPMVALGRVPADPAPAWITIAPAIKGTYRWSGTSILIFTPDPATPLPFATRYTVTVSAAATSATGRPLGAPYSFTFTTPTVRLISARWARQTNRFDSVVALALTFNQPVRPADVLAHTTARYQAHAWDAPTYTAAERARLTATDPEGLRQFDGKVMEVRGATAATSAVPVRLAANWDRQRFPPDVKRVVLETTVVPPPQSWLQITVDARMPSLSGPALPPRAQTSRIELPPAFFVSELACQNNCEPSHFNPVQFTVPVGGDAFARALTVRDVTNPANERVVTPSSAPSTGGSRDFSEGFGIETAGFDRQPGMTRRVLRIDSTLQSADGQTLGYPWIGIVETGRDRAITSFGDGHGVWEKSSGPLLPFYSKNYRTVLEWSQPIQPADLMARLVALTRVGFNERPPANGRTRTLTVTPDLMQPHGFDLSSALPASGTGLVWAAVAPGEAIPRAIVPPASSRRTSSTVVQVTNLGLAVKDSPSGTLLFVTRLDNGEVVADARVSLVNTKSETLWSGRTNREGIAIAPALPLRQRVPYREGEYWAREFQFIALAEKDGDVAYVGSDWTEGIEPWQFSLSHDPFFTPQVLRGSVFTDRGVYRPGEEIRFKAIVRTDTAAGIKLLSTGSEILAKVTDNRGREVDARTLKVNKWSGVDWTWTVPADGSVGDYSVTVSLPGPAKPKPAPGTESQEEEFDEDEWNRKINHSFLVAAYRRPDFRVETTLDAAAPIAGSVMKATVNGRYLFGNPMAKRSVRWTLERDVDASSPPAIADNDAWNDFRFGYYPDRSNPVERKVGGETATLDAEGKLALDLPAPGDVDIAFRYTFQGEVEDVSRQRIANRASVKVYPAPWLIGLRMPSTFAVAGRPASIDVAAVDLDGRARAGVSVKLSLTRVQWNSVRRATGSGFYEWDTERIETAVGEWTVQTAAAPVAHSLPVAEGGSYALVATATDAAGHRTRTDFHFYAAGAGYTAWERFDHNRIELKPERALWKPGETARVMIQSPWESATALLTTEREGIRSHRRFALTSTQQTVEIPITEADIPNVYVSVMLIRGRTSQEPGKDNDDPGKPAMRLGYVELKVEDASKKLAVKVAADRPEYRPANTAKVSVTVTDAIGKPSKSEVTLWAVDYGVLSLTGFTLPDVMRSVYRQKPLQVTTTDNRQRIVSRRVLTPKGEGEGGGGADAASAMRRDFRPLAFWLGSIETNGSGKATADVKLPDSLTTYHIFAIAGDAQSRFGSSQTEIRVSKPLTLLPAFPRFLSVGDRATFGGAVTNTLATAGSAVVTIKSLDPSVLTITGGSQTVTLGAQATEAVRFEALAKTVGTARVQMTAKLGSNTDAFETTLPVSVVAPVQTHAAFGEVTGRGIEKLAVPPGVVPEAGGLQVDLASTALVGLGEGVRYVIEYPYECAEQRASRALVLLLAADLGQAFSMSRIQPKDYRAQAASALKSLEKYQCESGAFALWPGACQTDNAYLTAYVLHVMKVAGTLGVTPDAAVVDAALNSLEGAYRQEAPGQAQWLPVWGASMAFGVKVLAEHGRNQDANITRLVSITDRLPIFALSYLADAMAASNDKGARYQDVIRRLTNALRVEGERAYVQELDRDLLAWIWSSNVTGTAVVLEGFARRGDDPAFVARMVRWLLAERKNGRWDNTHENARALLSLVGYYKAFETEVPNMTAAAAIGAKTIGTASFKGRSTDAQTMRLTMRDVIAAVGGAAASDLTFTQTGTGKLFYTTRLQFVTAEAPPAADNGVRVERRFETFVENGSGTPGTSYAAGDLVRVTLTVNVPNERRYVAVTDPLAAGFEAVDGWFRTTAADLAREASVQRVDGSTDRWEEWWRRGGFDRTEKYDDRVQLFATRLGPGRHEFSYLVRATTSGTFTAAGAFAEEMYSPEVNGRSAPVTIVIK